MDLPVGIISDILSRLPVDDITRCRCVCKSWYHLIMEPHFPYLHLTKSSEMHQPGDVDLLLSCRTFARYSSETPQDRLCLISNRDCGKWKNVKVPSLEVNLKQRKIKGSCNGLLCIATSTYPNLVYNPITRDQMTLPVLRFDPHHRVRYKCGFGFDSTNNYKVVVTYLWKSYIGDVRIAGAILTLGESSWRILQIPDKVGDIYYRDPLFFDGAFRWISAVEYPREFSSNSRVVFRGILTLDIATEKFEFTKFSPSLKLPLCLDLIQLGDSVALVADKKRSALRSFSVSKPLGPPSLEIWKILGANSDGSCHYEYRTFTVQVGSCPLLDLMRFELLCALGSNSFLFKVRGDSANDKGGYGKCCDHLVVYDSETDECSIIEVTGMPKLFDLEVFSPSLISPTL